MKPQLIFSPGKKILNGYPLNRSHWWRRSALRLCLPLLCIIKGSFGSFYFRSRVWRGQIYYVERSVVSRRQVLFGMDSIPVTQVLPDAKLFKVGSHLGRGVVLIA